MRNLFFENKLRTFEWLKLDHIFINPMSCNFCLFLKFFVPKAYAFESFIWGIFYMDFVGCLFRTSKLKNDISFY
jgi:hypothetical protein